MALALDVFVVAFLAEKSFGMFSSVIDVWVPQTLIFAATYLVGTFAVQVERFVVSRSGSIVAVDNYTEYLDELSRRAAAEQYEDHIKTIAKPSLRRSVVRPRLG